MKIFQIYGSSGFIFWEKEKVNLVLGKINMIAVEQMIDYLFFRQVVDLCMDLYVCQPGNWRSFENFKTWLKLKYT